MFKYIENFNGVIGACDDGDLADDDAIDGGVLIVVLPVRTMEKPNEKTRADA